MKDGDSHLRIEMYRMRVPTIPSRPSSTPERRKQGDSLHGLREALGDAGDFVRRVADSLATASARATTLEQRVAELERRLGEMEGGSDDLAARLVVSEQQTSRL